jgi:hypothetical protein
MCAGAWLMLETADTRIGSPVCPAVTVMGVEVRLRSS